LVAPNAPKQSGRGGRDRRSKFYELPDNLTYPVVPVSVTYNPSGTLTVTEGDVTLDVTRQAALSPTNDIFSRPLSSQPITHS
jgi:hypothetical protein